MLKVNNSSGIFVVNFEHILLLVSNFEQVNAGWVSYKRLLAYECPSTHFRLMFSGGIKRDHLPEMG